MSLFLLFHHLLLNTAQTDVHFSLYLAELCLEREMFQKKF